MEATITNEIRHLLEEIEVRVAKVREVIGDSRSSADNSDNSVKILVEVYNAGGVVTKEEWRKIAKKHGMDTRGLGGFFVGEGSMVRIGDNKRALTEKGSDVVKRYLEKQD